MAAKSRTTATFAVTIKVPQNATLKDMQQIIRNGTAGYSGGHPIDRS